MDEQNWFGTSESGHLDALKVASGDNITLTVSRVEVSCAGIFRQMDYNIPSNVEVDNTSEGQVAHLDKR